MNFENTEYDERIRKYRIENDFSPGKIANRLKVDREFIQFRLKRLELRFKYHNNIENQDEINAAILGNPDLTFKEIAKRLGVTDNNIRCQARKLGVRRMMPVTPIDDSVLINEYCSELRGRHEIAITHHYGDNRVKKRLKELGLLRNQAERFAARSERKSRKTGRAYPSCMTYPVVKIPEGHITRSRAIRGGFAMKHIITMEQKLGRPLTGNEKVHHIDFDKRNCTIDNLHLCESNSDHANVHHSLDEVDRFLFKKGVIVFKGGRYTIDKKAFEEYRASRGQDSLTCPAPCPDQQPASEVDSPTPSQSIIQDSQT
jgi:hypothetical protein